MNFMYYSEVWRAFTLLPNVLTFLKMARFLEPVYKSDYVTEPLQFFVSPMMDHKVLFIYSISCQFCQLSVL